ncbi:MYND Zn-finger protein [Ceratobasidium sp. AG-Ba]|nr:MYND Zn-finger protein [Ceratobasidium sp. AG-Ba]
MPQLFCQSCKRPGTKLKRCGSCSKVWYCDSVCQKNDWPIHLVDCNLGRPITTADRLVAFAYQGKFPIDPGVLGDYGFDAALTIDAQTKLLNMYMGLILGLGVKAKALHQARLSGKLIEFIKSSFDAAAPLPEGREEYYPWFLKHSYLLSPSLVHNDPSIYKEQNFIDSWRFIGGSHDDDYVQISKQLETWPDTRLYCFQLIRLVVMARRPPAGLGFPYRVAWGYVTCSTEAEEDELALSYKALVHAVSFDELHTAFATGSMPALFAAHGMPLKSRFLLDLFGPGAPLQYKPVWDLKEYVWGQPNKAKPKSHMRYGFNNCRNEGEVDALKAVYKRIFSHPNADPLALHDAYEKGKLFEYVNNATKLRPKELFERLLKDVNRCVGLLQSAEFELNVS